QAAFGKGPAEEADHLLLVAGERVQQQDAGIPARRPRTQQEAGVALAARLVKRQPRQPVLRIVSHFLRDGEAGRPPVLVGRPERLPGQAGRQGRGGVKEWRSGRVEEWKLGRRSFTLPFFHSSALPLLHSHGPLSPALFYPAFPNGDQGREIARAGRSQ